MITATFIVRKITEPTYLFKELQRYGEYSCPAKTFCFFFNNPAVDNSFKNICRKTGDDLTLQKLWTT